MRGLVTGFFLADAKAKQRCGDGYVTYKTTVTPRVDLEQEVKANLKTIAQAKWEAIKPVITSHVGDQLKLFRPTAFTMGASRREGATC